MNKSWLRLNLLVIPGLCALALMGLQLIPAGSVAAQNSSQKDSSKSDDSSDKKSDKDSNSNSDASADKDKRADDQNQNQGRQNGRRAWIGIRLQEQEEQPVPAEHAQGQNAKERGVGVVAVYPSGPASRAGLRANDRILTINGKAATSGREVSEAISNLQPGTKAEIVVLRNGSKETLQVTLGDAAAFQQQGNYPPQQQGAGEFQQRSYTYGGNQPMYAGAGYNNSNAQGGNFAQGYGNAYDGVPEHAMMLEYNRRNSEQHQRLETQIEELIKEVKMLRQEVQQLKAK